MEITVSAIEEICKSLDNKREIVEMRAQALFFCPEQSHERTYVSERRQIIIGNHAFRFNLERWRLMRAEPRAEPLLILILTFLNKHDTKNAILKSKNFLLKHRGYKLVLRILKGENHGN